MGWGDQGGAWTEPEAGDERPRFLGPLYELCAIGLYRPALEAFCAGASEVEETPIDRAYLLKILSEEVRRQFGHPLRPLVELVLNGIDASRGEERTLDVDVTEGSVEVRDQGEGMSLETLLSRLLVPFATDRRAGVDLGRFGVGFFSVMGLGLAHPQSFALHLTTGDGQEGWSMRVIVAGGGAPGRWTRGADEAAALVCSVRRIAARCGTRVRVVSALLAAEPVRVYLRDALHFFPSERATIRVDGSAINDGSLIVGGRQFDDRAAGVGPDGAPLVGRFHLGGRPRCAGIAAATYHAGVRVEACPAIGELALIDVPGAVELTEGRDALKPGPALNAVAAAFYRRLVRLGEEARADRVARDRLAELAAQISALMLQSAGWAEVARELADALLGPGRYLISPERREAVVGFLGTAAAARIFVPESFWAERQWQAVLPGERDLLDREIEIGAPHTLAGLAAARPDLGGLALLAARTAAADITPAALCHGRPGAGPLPCLGARRLVLIREDSAAVQRPQGWRDWYALRAAFDRAAGAREPDFERDLIVSEALQGDEAPWPPGFMGARGGER